MENERVHTVVDLPTVTVSVPGMVMVLGKGRQLQALEIRDGRYIAT